MATTRRDALKLAAAGALGLGLRPAHLDAQAPPAPPPPRPPTSLLTTAPITKAARPLNILILGGTGFTGPHQVRYALARGHKLTLFNRGRRPQDWPAEVEELTGDRNTGDYKSLEGRKWDVCIDNPTSLPVWVRDAGKVLKGNVGQYIFISTLSVHASEKEPNADETSALAEYTGPDPFKETQESLRANMALYGPLKARSEKEAEVWFPGTTTVIRPTLIVGPGDETDRFTYWPIRIDRGGDIAAPGDGSDPVQFIDARDLAEWTIRMAEDRKFGIYNATGPAAGLTMMEMLYGIRGATATPTTFHWLPVAFLEEQKVRPWGDMPVWVPGTGDMYGFSRRSNKKAIAAGLTFRPLAQTALDTLAWVKTWPPERLAKLRAGLTAEREQAVLAAWKAKKPSAGE
jgi:2'-hydroxyisoflavone reductase